MKYIYELRSINIGNLPQEEAMAVLENFQRFVNSLQEPVTFYVIQDTRDVPVGPDMYTVPYTRFFLESDVMLDDLMGILGAHFMRIPELPSEEIASIGGREMITAEGKFLRTYTVTRLAGDLNVGFLSTLYPQTQRLRVYIEPLDLTASKDEAYKRSRSVGTMIMMRNAEGRSIDPDDQILYQRTRGTSEAISAGSEKLFIVGITMTILADKHDDLIELGKKLKRQLAGSVGTVDSPKYLQYPLYTSTGPKWARGRTLFVPTTSLATLFPFSGLDVSDPAGVMLGQNLQTSNALIYDIFEKENYNLALMGQTGYGKSILIKTFFSRLVRMNPDMMVFLFDSIVKPEYALGPDGTYESSFAAMIGATVHRYRMNDGAGLDPFKVFRKGEAFDSPSDTRRASSFIASLAHIEDERDLLADLYITAETCNSVAELVEKSPDRLKRQLEAQLAPFMFLFEGKFIVDDRMVFVLNDIPNAEIRDAAAFLTLAAVWQTIRNQPVARKKAVVIDEGWAMVETNPRTGKPYFPLAVEFVPEIARTDRHYNTCLTIATQLVSDFLGRGDQVGPGRAMIESCATKVVLKQDQAATESIEKALHLSEVERKFVLNAKVGNGLLIGPEGHIPFFNMLSDAELASFTTRPSEVGKKESPKLQKEEAGADAQQPEVDTQPHA